MKPRIGLTGGIGSGKSTVAHFLEQLGCFLIDADKIARGLTMPDGAAIPAIREQFGEHFISPDNALDRTQMREAVFHDPSAKQRLEGILHPLIKHSIFEQYAHACAHTSAPLVIFDIPLLAESAQWATRLDRVVVVDCTEATQIVRVQQRNQLAPEAIHAIMAQQASRLQRLRKADWVIWNETVTLQALGDEVLGLYNELIAAFPSTTSV